MTDKELTQLDSTAWLEHFLPDHEDWLSVKDNDPISHSYACGWFAAIDTRSVWIPRERPYGIEAEAYEMGWEDGKAALRD